MNIGERIKSRREGLKLSQQALAAMCGWENATRISNYENNYREPTLQDIMLLAKALDIAPNALAFGDNYASKELPQPKVSGLPILDWSMAVNWPENKKDILEEEKTQFLSNEIVLGPNCYTLVVNDDSMLNNFKMPVFHEGLKIIVDPDKKAQCNNFVIAKINDKDLLFRKYVKYADKEYIQSLNNNIPEPLLPIIDNVKIQGVVVAYLGVLI
jgi:SOS-response transcriptional repressor LexA